MTGKPRAFLSWLLLTLGLVACAPWADIATMDKDVMNNPWHHWRTEGPAKAVILALHGFNDYSNAFEFFAAYANQRDIAVHAYDQRGFGANEDAGRWPGTDRMVADLHRAAEELRQTYPDTPLYVLGESMGGAVTIVAAAGEEALAVDGLILVAPAVWGGDQFNIFYRATLWLASTVAPGWKLTGKGLEIWPSDNIDMLRTFSADPLVIKGTRADALAGLVGLMDEAQASLDQLDQDMLILVGEKDEVVPAGAFASMLSKLNTSSCKDISYPNGYHMLLRDLQREIVYEDIKAWIDEGPEARRISSTCRLKTDENLMQNN